MYNGYLVSYISVHARAALRLDLCMLRIMECSALHTVSVPSVPVLSLSALITNGLLPWPVLVKLLSSTMPFPAWSVSGQVFPRPAVVSEVAAVPRWPGMTVGAAGGKRWAGRERGCLQVRPVVPNHQC